MASMLKWSLITLTTLSVLAGAGYFFYNQLNKPIPPLKQPVSQPVTSPDKTLMLDLIQPENDILTFASTTEVIGKTSPNTSVVISTNNQDFLISSDDQGNFTTKINLTSGVNRINVVVFSKDGDRKSQLRVIYYSKEKI